MVKKVSVFGLEGFPLIKAGDDLPSLIVAAARKNDLKIEEGDIVVVAQKVISKAEDRIVKVDVVHPSRRALEIADVTGRDPRIVELIVRESKRFLKASRQIIVVEDQRDIVNINAGIDKSNVQGANRYALLPLDPDQSASRIRHRILELTGKNVGVIISDTYSRGFRRGQVNFAIGLAGVNPFVDYRGKEDLFGYVMQVKFTAVVDELAGAAELVMGQGNEATPVVLIRGVNRISFGEGFSSRDLVIGEEEDLFRDVR